MRKVLSFFLALWFSVSPFLNGLLASVLAAPTVGAPLASPSAVPAGVATLVTVTSQITSGPGDPPVLSNGVNLLQVDPQDRVLAILGTMRDDGLGGDAVARDGVFTLRITVNQAAAGDIRLRVSAAFRGRAQRVISPATTIAVQIAQNQPPVFTSSPNTTATEASLYQYQVAAQDPEGGQLSFQLVSGPSGMTIGQGTGLVQWTPTHAQVGDQNVQLQAIDPQGAQAVQSFTIHVAALNLPPVISSVPTITASTTLLYLYQVVAQDPEGGALTYQLVSGPTGMTVDSTTGLVMWTPTTAQIGNQNVQLKVVDPQGAETPQNFRIAVSELNLAPVITSVPITFAKTTEEYVYNVTAYDPEKKTIQFSFSEPQPSGMTIDAASGAVRWLPTNAQVGNVRVAVRATDPAGAYDTQAFNLKVFDPTNDLQIISPTGPQSIRIGQTLTLPLQANYADAIFSVDPKLSNASIVTNSFTFNPTSDQEGVQTITFKARYGDMQKSVVIPITVTRDNSSPVIAPVGQQSVQEGASLTFTISASDAENDPLTYAAPGLNLANAFFNTFSHQFTFNPVVGQAGSYQVVFSVSDGKATSQITVPIQVTKSTGQQQVLDLVLDPLSNPTLQGSATISGNVTGQPGTPQPKQTPPLVTGLLPSGAKQGQTLTVQITGLNTNFGQTTTRADFGSGITVNSLTVTSATAAQANITIDKLASLGVRNVRMIGAGTEAQSVVAFNVEKGVASITGTVIDPFTQQPLANATISINGTTISALTDSQGRFTLTDVPTGSVPLVITLPNYDVQQFTIGVGASDTIALPDPVKLNALARPPRLAGTLPRAATVASVLDRGIASVSNAMTLEDAKAAVSDTMIAVGGSEAGVVDENGNQLNPKLQGLGTFSLTPQGVENHARTLRLGQTYRLGDLLFELRSVFGFMLDFGSDSQTIFNLQSVVNDSWANPDSPSSAMAFIVFSAGNTRSATPPVLTADTRLNSFQAFLFQASFISSYAVEINQAIIDLAGMKGVPPPQTGWLGILENATALAGRAGGTLGNVVAALSGMLAPGVALAEELTVAERRLKEQETWTAFWQKQRFKNVLKDFALGAIPALALSWTIGTCINRMIGVSGGLLGAVTAASGQALLAAAIGGTLNVVISILKSYGLENAKGLGPDAPIGQSATLLGDGSGEVIFSKSNGDALTTVRLPNGTVVRQAPVTFTTAPLISTVDYLTGGIDPSKLEYHYFIFKVRTVDDENVVSQSPLPIEPQDVTDSQGKVIPDKLKFKIPAEYLKDGPNYFRMLAIQRLRGSVIPPGQIPQPYHYSDMGIDVPSQFPDWLGNTVSFALGFSPPGYSFTQLFQDFLGYQIKYPNIFKFIVDPQGPDYLAKQFRDASAQAAKNDIAAREKAYQDALSDYYKQFNLTPDTDLLTKQALLAEHEQKLQELRTQRQAVLDAQKASLDASAAKSAQIMKLVADNPGTIFADSNPVTAEIANILGLPGPLPLDLAQALAETSNASLIAQQAQATLKLQDDYRVKMAALEANLRRFQAEATGTVQPQDVAQFNVQGRPQFEISGSKVKDFVGTPSFQEDAVIRVSAPFDKTTPFGNIQLTIDVPGKAAQPFTWDALSNIDIQRQTSLKGLISDYDAVLQQANAQIRRISVSDFAMQQAAADVADLDIKSEQVQSRISELEGDITKLNAMKTQAEAAANAVPEETLARVKSFQAGVTKVTNGIAVAGIIFFWQDTSKSLQLAISNANSYLSETRVIVKSSSATTLTTRIASDPLVGSGILAVQHLTKEQALQDPNNANRRFPIVDGSVALMVYNQRGVTQTTPIPSTGFPSDVFAVDSDGRIYADNANSNENYGGRIFRFTRSIPQGGTITRDFAGAINYYSLDAFMPARPTEPIAMAIGNFCCDNNGSHFETPFVADIDYDVSPPAGRVVRIPIELIGRTQDNRVVGQPWVESGEIKLETPSTLVPGDPRQLPHSPLISVDDRPLFLSDGQRIWMIQQKSAFDSGILTKIVDTPGRQWAGLMVDPNGNLFALDASAGEVWALPLAAVQAAIATQPLLSEDSFRAAAFLVAENHQNALDLAGTSKGLGFVVADAGGAVNLHGNSVVGVLPADVTVNSLEMVLPNISTPIPVKTYTSGGQNRFVVQIPTSEMDYHRLTLVASVNDSVQERRLEIEVRTPLFGVYFVPDSDLAKILKRQP